MIYQTNKQINTRHFSHDDFLRPAPGLLQENPLSYPHSCCLWVADCPPDFLHLQKHISPLLFHTHWHAKVSNYPHHCHCCCCRRCCYWSVSMVMKAWFCLKVWHWDCSQRDNSTTLKDHDLRLWPRQTFASLRFEACWLSAGLPAFDGRVLPSFPKPKMD